MLVAVLAVVILAGAAVGVGPIGASPSPDQVRDPREMVARSLQAVLDADALHLEASLTGHLPGSLIDRPEAVVVVDGTTAEGDILPGAVRARVHLESVPLDLNLDAVSVWDDAWYRIGSDGWQRASVTGASSEAGMDVNPLTLVDRVRGLLARPDLVPVSTDVACIGTAGVATSGPSGMCHRIVLDAEIDPTSLLAAILPDVNRTALPPLSTRMTLDTDSGTLRPVRLVIDLASGDGSIDLHFTVATSRWDDPSLVIEVPATGS